MQNLQKPYQSDNYDESSNREVPSESAVPFESAVPSESIEKYKRSVDFFIKNAINYEFENSNHSCAQAVIATLLKYSTKEILIFAENLNPQVYESPEVINELREALNRGVQIQAISQEHTKENHHFIEILKNSKSSGSFFKSGEQVESLRNKRVNYIVMDGRAHRTEEDKDSPYSFVNGNDEYQCNRLRKNFQSICALLEASQKTKD